MGFYLVAQTVKNLPAMWETWIQSLGWEDPLEESLHTHSSMLASESPMNRGACWAIGPCGHKESDMIYSPWGCKESDTTAATACIHAQI